MAPDKHWALRVADARAWVLSLGADLPTLLGESRLQMVAGKLVVKSPPGGTDLPIRQPTTDKTRPWCTR
ncbi:hypothetical protein [Paraburkholderia phenazinium]|jgi:hypothetical protein|uniref:Uncharacterized protein n=1 Tax=Paraburkholderia phenazinium TaxID=60549 RepID=A0A1G8IXR1_9BURK|nr:hypothetical protein [Paraburkholderia phenazinium]SDI23719.1 hypothetical protein SAMN05216466_11957 [Paraburkholderia phenazinium]